MKDPIFIVGPHRAGSTVWHNLVAMCPGILRLAEARFLGPPRKQDFRFFLQTQGGDLAIDSDVKKMVELSFSRKGIPGLGGAFWRFEGIEIGQDAALMNSISQAIMNSDRSLGAIARAYIEEITKFNGYSRACVKFPVEVADIPELVEWFPDCRIIHISRDPRGLAMSKTNDPFGTAIRILKNPRLAWFIRKLTILHVVREYRNSSRHHERYKGLENYQLFLYEDLLADPPETLKRLCTFIDVPYNSEYLELEKSEHEHQPSSLTGRRNRGLDPRAAVRWKTKISRCENAMVSTLTRRSMLRFGYDSRDHGIFRAAADFQPVQDQPVVG